MKIAEWLRRKAGRGPVVSAEMMASWSAAIQEGLAASGILGPETMPMSKLDEPKPRQRWRDRICRRRR